MPAPDLLATLIEKGLTILVAGGFGYVASWMAFGKRIDTAVEKKVEDEFLKRSVETADARAQLAASIEQIKASNQVRDARDEAQAQEAAASWQAVQRTLGKIEGTLEAQQRRGGR